MYHETWLQHSWWIMVQVAHAAKKIDSKAKEVLPPCSRQEWSQCGNSGPFEEYFVYTLPFTDESEMYKEQVFRGDLDQLMVDLLSLPRKLTTQEIIDILLKMGYKLTNIDPRHVRDQAN